MKGLAAILGQEAATGSLYRALASGRVASAYLFEGTQGVGKRTTALALAQALNCERAAETPGGCGACEPCRKVAERLHPDVLVVEPDGQFIRIAQVRQLTARTAYRPHEGRARVVVLDPADALNLEAANALLKTLEEPPPSTHFVLVSATPDRLPLTVRSRCRRVRFAPLGDRLIARRLVEERALGETEARLVAGLAGGSLGAALELCGSEALERRRAQVDRIEAVVRQSGAGELLDAAAELKEEREALPQSLELLRVLYRDALLAALGLASGRVVHADRPEALAALAGLGPDRLRRRIDAVVEAETALRANVNTQLCLERMMLRLRDC